MAEQDLMLKIEPYLVTFLSISLFETPLLILPTSTNLGDDRWTLHIYTNVYLYLSIRI